MEQQKRDSAVSRDSFKKMTAAEDLTLRNSDPDGESIYAFGTTILKQDVAAIQFLGSLDGAPENAEDVSETGNGKVLLWSEPTRYGSVNLCIAGDGKVYFPKNSRSLFGGIRDDPWEPHSGPFHYFCRLHDIEFGDTVCTDLVESMNGMFLDSPLSSLDLSCFNTKNVTDMCGMFCDCYFLESLNVRSFCTENVRDMGLMFADCSNLGRIIHKGLQPGCRTSVNAFQEEFPSSRT